jgi:hypothetical protein
MTLKSLFVGALFVLLLASFAQAQTTATIKPSQLKAAEDLIAASNIERQMSSIYANMVTAASSQIPEDKKAKFKTIMLTFLSKYMSFTDLKQEMARIYAEEFTEAELKEITRFYLTPVGKKTIEKLPSLQQKGMAIAQQKLQAHLPELQQTMQAELGN